MAHLCDPTSIVPLAATRSQYWNLLATRTRTMANDAKISSDEADTAVVCEGNTNNIGGPRSGVQLKAEGLCHPLHCPRSPIHFNPPLSCSVRPPSQLLFGTTPSFTSVPLYHISALGAIMTGFLKIVFFVWAGLFLLRRSTSITTDADAVLQARCSHPKRRSSLLV